MRVISHLLLPIISLSAQSLFCADLSLVVEARMTRATVKDSEDFGMLTAVRNTGSSEVEMRVWSCSYSQQWETDSRSVRVKPTSCRKNYLTKISLAPGQAYEKAIILSVVDVTRPQSIHFRLAFTPVMEGGVAAQPIWSQEITAEVQ